MRITPTFDEAARLAGDYKVIPVSCEIYSDAVTPIEVLRKLKYVSRHCYLLESAFADEKWGRFTFLGYDPKMEITCKDGVMNIKSGSTITVETKKPGKTLREIINDYKSPVIEGMPPFTGGLVGYFAYDYIKYSEPNLKITAENRDNFKDFDLMLFDKVGAFDNYKQKIVIIVNCRCDSFESEYHKTERELLDMRDLILNGSRKTKIGVVNLKKGRYGIHGGQYIPETLMNAVNELEEAYNFYKNDIQFNDELNALFNEYAGRPSRLYYAEKMTRDLGGAKIYLKREDLNHTGAHKINNVLGQTLLAKKMGKTRVIAETGAGQHGVATATAAALMGMECEVFMGLEDTKRQALNVYKMRLLGAKVHPVESGTATLKDAVSETMREWTKRIDDTHYVLGSVMGPHPFPEIVRDFQSVISKEIKEQMLEKEGRLPDAVLACVGGGSNAIGAFYHFINTPEVALIGCEAAGRGVNTKETAATIATGRLGIFHGMKSYFCQDEYGQIAPVYSISAGLDYPGVGPEHAHLYDIKRAQYVPVTDDEAVDAFEYMSRTEGIIPAIESAHAVAHAMKLAPRMEKDKIIVINISGRGDKDCAAIARYRGEDISE